MRNSLRRLFRSLTKSLLRTSHTAMVLAAFAWIAIPSARADDSKLVLHRGGSTIVLEPYAPNIVRLTLSLKEDKALAAPGYGFVAKPMAEGWKHQETEAGDEY